MLQRRADPLLVEASEDMHTWFTVHRTKEGQLFGVEPHSDVPLICRPERRSVCRYVRVSVPGKRTILHLVEVEVYGYPL